MPGDYISSGTFYFKIYFLIYCFKKSSVILFKYKIYKGKNNMDLIGSLTGLNNVRGITLNSQQIDLFNIIEQMNKKTLTREQAIQRVNEYLGDILQASKLSKEIIGSKRLKR